MLNLMRRYILLLLFASSKKKDHHRMTKVTLSFLRNFETGMTEEYQILLLPAMIFYAGSTKIRFLTQIMKLGIHFRFSQ